MRVRVRVDVLFMSRFLFFLTSEREKVTLL